MNSAVVRGTLSGGAYFARRYRIVRALAAGGMGAVYEVFDEATRSPRALKVMLPSVVESPEHRMRFEREAQLTGAIESEHLVRITDAGIDGDVPFIVMELLRGEDLRSLLRKRGRLPPELVVPYLRQVALGLEKTHAAGIIHRDLKPANLFLAQRDDGTPCMKVLDFGIAKLTTASSAIETGTVGTPLYMAPEQARGDRGVTHLADLLALAHVAYALLVGEAYFQDELEQSDSIVGVFMAVADGPREPPCVRSWRRKSVRLPPAFDSWFLQAAAAQPEARFQNARAEIEALANALAGSSAAAQVKTAAMVASAFEPPRGASPGAQPAAHALQPAHAPQPPQAQAALMANASASHGGAWSEASGQVARVPRAAVAAPAKPPPWLLWGAGGMGFGVLVALVAFVGWSAFEDKRTASASQDDGSGEEGSDEDDEPEPSQKKRASKSAKTPSAKAPASSVAGCFFERCRTFATPADGRFDPLAALEQAEALARSLVPDAQPTLFKVSQVRRGAAELDGEKVAMMFIFEGTERSVSLLLMGNQLGANKPEPVSRRRDEPMRPPGPRPCAVARVWVELRKAGVGEDEIVQLDYHAFDDSPARWVVDREPDDITLDARTCARIE